MIKNKAYRVGEINKEAVCPSEVLWCIIKFPIMVSA